jgi:hypothetical protein
MAEAYDYEYEHADERLLYYLSLPPIAKLRWLDDARRFTLLARRARESAVREPEPGSDAAAERQTRG